jgi:protoporphyrinogen oxidase
MILILGAGLSGLSTSYHVVHESCSILEKNNYLGGHIHSDHVSDFVFDGRPHLSFTSNEMSKNYLLKV